MKTTLQIGSCSMRGVGEFNEDALACYRFPDAVVCVVADGQGGWFDELGGGRRASQQATESIGRVTKENLPSASSRAAIARVVKESILQAHADIVDSTLRHGLDRVGASVVVGLWCHGSYFYIASVGDCRAYMMRGIAVDQLTKDDDVARAMFEAGNITADEAKASPWRHVLYKYLGCGQLGDRTEVLTFLTEIDDCFVLCSDGLHKFVAEETLMHMCTEQLDAQTCAESLCQQAMISGSRDNITCMVIKVVDDSAIDSQ